MKRPGKVIGILTIIFVGLSLASLLTPEHSAAFPPTNNQTPTLINASLNRPGLEYAIFLPLIFRPPGPVYLPLVARAASPTPTNTPITPIPNPVKNGGFEQANNENGPWYAAIQYIGWTDPAGIDVRDTLAGTGAYPHDGSWASWLGGYPYGSYGYQMWMAQEITIPANGSTLRYWRWIQSDEPVCTIDYDGAWVYFVTSTQNEVEAYPLCWGSATSGWVKRELDLSAYAGQKGWLYFVVRILGANSNLFIDDVAMGTLPARPLLWQTPEPPRTTTPKP